MTSPRELRANVSESIRDQEGIKVDRLTEDADELAYQHAVEMLRRSIVAFKRQSERSKAAAISATNIWRFVADYALPHAQNLTEGTNNQHLKDAAWAMAGEAEQAEAVAMALRARAQQAADYAEMLSPIFEEIEYQGDVYGERAKQGAEHLKHHRQTALEELRTYNDVP